MCQRVARGNIQQIKLHSPDETPSALRAYADASGECLLCRTIKFCGLAIIVNSDLGLQKQTILMRV